MSEVRFFSAYVITNPDRPFKFEIEELEIKNVFPDGTIELKNPYFYCKNDSTYYFGGSSGHRINEECNLTYGMALYSTNELDCKDFISRKMREMDEQWRKIYKRLKESRVEVKYLGDNK